MTEISARIVTEGLQSVLTEGSGYPVSIDLARTGKVAIKYRTGATEAACLAARWYVYNSTSKYSLGYIQFKIEVGVAASSPSYTPSATPSRTSSATPSATPSSTPSGTPTPAYPGVAIADVEFNTDK